MAVKVTLVLEHVRGPLLEAEGVGGAISCDTIILAVAVHPFVLLVTVTVYVPGLVTLFVLDAPPPLHA